MTHSWIRRLAPTCALITLAACAGEVNSFVSPADTEQDESANVAPGMPVLLRQRFRNAPQPVSHEVESPAVAPVSQPLSAAVMWNDAIQESSANPWGFSQVALEYPIGTPVQGSSAVNLQRVQNPLGSGFALQHTATFDATGARSQAGIYSSNNRTFGELAKSEHGVWVAQEWYFPQTISASTDRDSAPWLNLWDWHSTAENGDNRWDTQPGLMLAQDGSMKVRWVWHSENSDTDWSSVALPVGRWFDIEMHYVWTDTADGATVSLWIDGQLALEQRGVRTKDASHSIVETYMKFYGSSHSTSPGWGPGRLSKFTRNVRIAGERIWH